MISLSDNDQKIIEFLIRNYTGRFTTREIGIKLGTSPAGAYKSLKKLEKEKIVVAEKLGTGLFFDIDYSNQSAYYLACFVLSQKEHDIKELKEHSKAVLKSESHILVVSHHHNEELVKGLALKIFKQEKITFLSEDEFSKKIMTKDKHTAETIKESDCLFGAEFIVKSISRMIK